MNADSEKNDTGKTDTEKADTENNEGHDAQWRAFRYVLGEMSSAEAEAFEEFLATDLKTCELVAQSTGLVTDLLTVEPVEAARTAPRNGANPVTVRSPEIAAAWNPRRSERFGRWATTGVAAAVCCAVAIGLSLFSLKSTVPEDSSADPADSGAGHLVAVWSQRLAELAPETATTEPAASERSDPASDGLSQSGLMSDGLSQAGETDDSRLATSTENASADSAAVGDQMASADSDVPGWMLAAVELGHARKPAGSSPEIWEN